ncbi:hypothetical protein KIPB_003232 [Kipferlia bialata]|uniref:Uncharacterized protein n=1 Tax=Kipferlia bialata TaxID=797122 RepID=A0A9K3CT37_9EUKA|nr:hypothetical protein KIPB_003232 [Kipferlia bialata]|eukprot:g3232.t1
MSSPATPESVHRTPLIGERKMYPLSMGDEYESGSEGEREGEREGEVAEQEVPRTPTRADQRAEAEGEGDVEAEGVSSAFPAGPMSPSRQRLYASLNALSPHAMSAPVPSSDMYTSDGDLVGLVDVAYLGSRTKAIPFPLLKGMRGMRQRIGIEQTQVSLSFSLSGGPAAYGVLKASGIREYMPRVPVRQRSLLVMLSTDNVPLHHTSLLDTIRSGVGVPISWVTASMLRTVSACRAVGTAVSFETRCIVCVGSEWCVFVTGSAPLSPEGLSDVDIQSVQRVLRDMTEGMAEVPTWMSAVDMGLRKMVLRTQRGEGVTAEDVLALSVLVEGEEEERERAEGERERETLAAVTPSVPRVPERQEPEPVAEAESESEGMGMEIPQEVEGEGEGVEEEEEELRPLRHRRHDSDDVSVTSVCSMYPPVPVTGRDIVTVTREARVHAAPSEREAETEVSDPGAPSRPVPTVRPTQVEIAHTESVSRSHPEPSPLSPLESPSGSMDGSGYALRTPPARPIVGCMCTKITRWDVCVDIYMSHI